MIKSYYIAKVISKLHLPSFKKCTIDPTSKVDSRCVLTKVTMGKYSYAASDTHITDAVIGNFCSIGSNCFIGGGVHPMNMVSMSPVFLKGHNFLNKNFYDFPYAPSSTVNIGNDVWIGDGAYIKSGVKVSDGAVIGAHAVVVKDVLPYEVVAGVPARRLRLRFNQDIVDKLLTIKWWNFSDTKLQQYSQYFDDPLKLIDAFEKSNSDI